MADKKQNMPAVPEYTKAEIEKAKGPFNGDQLNTILKRTPKNMLYTRPAKGGGEWIYVSGSWIKKILNVVFGWNWDFTVVNFDVNMIARQAIVHGRLTVRSGDVTIVKEQFGRSDIAFKRVQEVIDGKPQFVKTKNGERPKMVPGDEPLDLGNDLKAASTDALKKCASELGIASDVYAPNEYKEIKILGDEQAESVSYWKGQLAEAIDMCQDEGLADALRKEALELQERKASASEYRDLIKKLK